MPGRLVALVALLALGCAKVPYTNRSQLILGSQQEEAALGTQAVSQVVAKSRIDPSPNVNRDVREVGERLAQLANRPDFQWKLVAIDTPRQVTAFCLPWGKVALYTVIRAVARDQAGLAVVLGHEIARAAARHGAERSSEGVVAQCVAQRLAIGLRAGAESAMILAAYRLGAEYGGLLP